MNEYATDKLSSHPLILEKLRQGKSQLTTVHLMPQNACNHGCSFCSYRMPENKNSVVFDESKHIPWDDLVKLTYDFDRLGVQGVEITGGGEPLAYPNFEKFWELMTFRNFRTALVTNGTLLKDRAPLVTASGLSWARVSIDASTASVYSAMRKCPESHFERAWEAVAQLREHAPADPDFRLGVGFVLDNHNIDEVYNFVKRAKDSGADNVRLSVCFSDQGTDYFTDDDKFQNAITESAYAEDDFHSDTFHVNNLIPIRAREIAHPEQDYDKCYVKDVLCVVEGECKVYTCCTFTGSTKGCYGKFTNHPDGFIGLWEENEDWRRDFVARDYCKVTCLYRDRNLSIAKLVKGQIHKEFI